MNIDWSKAPEWATAHGVVSSFNYKTWIGENEYQYVNTGIKYRFGDPCTSGTFNRDEFREVTERPAPTWKGEGLPPVGLDVEAYFNADTNPDWLPFTLQYSSEENVVFRGPIGECHMSRRAFDKYGFKFRPIRTPDQVAAEKREKVIDQIIEDLRLDPINRYIAARAYDAGYRKFEIVEEDV